MSTNHYGAAPAHTQQHHLTASHSAAQQTAHQQQGQHQHGVSTSHHQVGAGGPTHTAAHGAQGANQHYNAASAPFSSAAPYLSNMMGLLPQSSAAADASYHHQATQHHDIQQQHGAPPQHHGHGLTQHGHPQAGAPGHQSHLSQSSIGVSNNLGSLSASVRPTIAKRGRNSARSRSTARAASAIEGDPSAVMLAAQHAAAAAAATPQHANGLQPRFLQQFQQQQHNGNAAVAAAAAAAAAQQRTNHGAAGYGGQQYHAQQLHPTAAHQMMHPTQHQQFGRHLSSPNMVMPGPPTPTGPVYECDGIQFKTLEELAEVKVKRLKSEKIKPIEELTFDDIKAYNRNQLRAYCFVYGIKRKKKAEMEQNMARYAAMFHPGDPDFDVSKFVPTDYLPGPIPRRKVPVTKEQKAMSAGKFAARFLPTQRPRAAAAPSHAYAAPAPATHYAALHTDAQRQRQQSRHTAAHQAAPQHTDAHDPLNGFPSVQNVMVPSHLLSDMGEE